MDTSSSLRDVVEEASEGGNPISYAVVGTNADGVSCSSDAVEISIDGSSVSCIVAGSGVDTSSSFFDVVNEGSDGDTPVSYAVVGTTVDGVSGSVNMEETSMDGSSVSYIVA